MKKAHDFIRLAGFEHAGIAAQVGKHNGRIYGDLLRFLDLGEHHFADGAKVWVHLARLDAKNPKRPGEGSPQRNGHLHVL